MDATSNAHFWEQVCAELRCHLIQATQGRSLPRCEDILALTDEKDQLPAGPENFGFNRQIIGPLKLPKRYRTSFPVLYGDVIEIPGLSCRFAASNTATPRRSWLPAFTQSLSADFCHQREVELGAYLKSLGLSLAAACCGCGAAMGWEMVSQGG